MIPAAVIAALLLWSATGHGKPIACASNTCPAGYSPIGADMGPHYDKRHRVEVEGPDGQVDRAGPAEARPAKPRRLVPA